MKNMFKAAAVAASLAFVGTSAYMLGNDNLRKKKISHCTERGNDLLIF